MGNFQKVLLTLSSLFFGSSLSIIFTNLFYKHLPFTLFSADLPGVTERMVLEKTYDFFDFAATIIFSLGIFYINFLLVKRAKHNNLWPFLLLCIGAFLLFVVTHFVTFSKTHMLIFFLSIQGLFVMTIFKKAIDLRDLKSSIPALLMNGVFLGFYLFVIFKQTLPTPAFLIFSLSPLILIIAAAYGRKARDIATVFPGYLFLGAIFFQENLLYLVVLGAFILITGLLLGFSPPSRKPQGFTAQAARFLIPWMNSLAGIGFRFGRISAQPKADEESEGFNPRSFNKIAINAAKIINPLALIFLLVYNPTFYLGNFDNIEEGYLLGWLQALSKGEFIYRDFVSYQTPILIWGMNLFSKIAGYSVYNERLYLHLLQILGITIYYFVIKKVLSQKWSLVFILLLASSFSFTYVRNNAEIRLALGLLSFLPFFTYLEKKSYKWLAISGVVGAFSFLTSLEVGAVTILSLLILINLFTKLNYKANTAYVCGVLVVIIPFMAWLHLNSAFAGFIEQTTFYSSVFSQGYFNLPIERATSLSFFHWHIFEQYLSSKPFLWEAARFLLLGGFIYAAMKAFGGEKLNLNHKFIFSLSLFGLLMFRVALGRSDLYHLIFVLLVCFVVFGYLLEKLSQYSIALTATLVFATVFLFMRPQINDIFLEQQFYKFQTYSQIYGEYKHYTFERGKDIVVGQEIPTNDVDLLVSEIQKNTKVDERIFAFPWMPEIYFFSDRGNATMVDIPYSFFSQKYQAKIVEQLEMDQTKYVVFTPDTNFAGMSADTLPLVKDYLLVNFKLASTYGKYQLLERK